MPPLERVKQRKLFQWAVAYFAGAWLVLQVLGLVAQPFAWPDLVLRAATVLLGIGFFPVLILAWYHGEKGRQSASGVELLMLAGILLIAGIAVASVSRDGKHTSSPALLAGATRAPGSRSVGAPSVPAGPIRTIAVLPLVNMSGDPKDEYFSDGITEEILNALAQIPDLQVTGRTSSFAYKGKNVDLRQVGRDLGVGAVLEGSVQRSGGMVRITAQLIDTRTDFHLWSEKYDRQVKSVFAVEDEISRAIAEQLQLRLLGGGVSRPARGTEDVRAHELYLLGLQRLNRRDIPRAVDYFQQAIARDSGFAAAWAGLASARAVEGTWTAEDGRVLSVEGRAAAERALALDSTLAEAHAALGEVAQMYDFDWATGERELRKAIALDPSSVNAHIWLGDNLRERGLWDRALPEQQRAVELDPGSAVASLNLGLYYFDHRDYPKAEASFRRTRDLQPELSGEGWLIQTYLITGGFTEARATARHYYAARGVDPALYLTLIDGIADPARRPEALRVLASPEGPTPDAHEDPLVMAHWYALLGQRGPALDWLERAVDLHEGLVTEIGVDPRVDLLRGEPRFQSLLRRLNLPTLSPDTPGR